MCLPGIFNLLTVPELQKTPKLAALEMLQGSGKEGGAAAMCYKRKQTPEKGGAGLRGSSLRGGTPEIQIRVRQI